MRWPPMKPPPPHTTIFLFFINRWKSESSRWNGKFQQNLDWKGVESREPGYAKHCVDHVVHADAGQAAEINGASAAEAGRAGSGRVKQAVADLTGKARSGQLGRGATEEDD